MLWKSSSRNGKGRARILVEILTKSKALDLGVVLTVDTLKRKDAEDTSRSLFMNVKCNTTIIIINQSEEEIHEANMTFESNDGYGE